MRKPAPIIRLCLVILASLPLLSCVGETGDELPLTFSPRGCSYEAAEVLDPLLTVNWIIEGDTAQEYAYLLLTMDKGKTKSDLHDWLAQSTDHPSWAMILSWDTAGEGGKKTPKQLDFSANASFNGTPVYIVCAIGEQLFVEGPIKIKD